MNTAFLYIKPHAATDKTKALVERELKSSGLSIMTEGTMQTNDIKANPRIVHFNSEVMRPDSHIFYYVVQWSETNMSWAKAADIILHPDEQGIRGKIMALWRDLHLEDEPRGVHDSVYFSDSALTGLADRIEWLDAKMEKDPTGIAIEAAGYDLFEEARFWVRNVSVKGKPAFELCRGYSTSELIAALKENLTAPPTPLVVTSMANDHPTAPPVSDTVFVDSEFRKTEESWNSLKNVLRSNPAALVPQVPCAEQISAAPGLNGSVLAAFVELAHHSRADVDRLFVTKSVRPDGHYVLQLFRDASWTSISIDDAVPVSGGKVQYIDSQRGQWWPLMLYKALAKLWGSYESLKSATFVDVMHALTGKPVFVQHLRNWHDKDGVEVPPSTGYLGDPATSAFWTRLGNRAIKQQDIVTGRVGPAGPTYHLEVGSSIMLVAAVKINDDLIFKVYRPEHTYQGPYGPGSTELADQSIRDKLHYADDEAANYFYTPQTTFAELCDYLVITKVTDNNPLVVTGPWAHKMGLPGSTLFRRGVAIQCTNTTDAELKLSVMLKKLHGTPGADVGLCAVGARDGPAFAYDLLARNLIASRADSTLTPDMATLNLYFAPKEAVTVLPVMDPVQGGTFTMLFYGKTESVSIKQLEDMTQHPLDWDTAAREQPSDTQRLVSIHAPKSTALAILVKRYKRVGKYNHVDDSASFIQVTLYRANSNEVVASMTQAHALEEVALPANVQEGVYDVAVTYIDAPDTEETKALIEKYDDGKEHSEARVRVTVFSPDDSDVILSACRNVEAERLDEARQRERRLRQRSLSAANDAHGMKGPSQRMGVFFEETPSTNEPLAKTETEVEL